MLDNFKQSRKTDKLFKDFSHLKDLVYFGAVDVHQAEDPVKGITFGSKRRDTCYVHGAINDYEITLLQRETSLKYPSQNSGDYDWTVLRVKLKASGLPHIFIDAHQYDELFYKDIFTKFARLRMANNNLVSLNESFTDYFHVFVSPDTALNLAYYLPDVVMQRMLANFQELDVEISNDSLYIYRNGHPERTEQLSLMVDESIWLAEHTERVFEQLKHPEIN